MSVKDNNTLYRRIMRDLRLKRSASVFVGVRGKGDSKLLTYAAANEFGTRDGHVPERSYLRSTVEEQKQAYAEELTRVIEGAVGGTQPLELGMGLLGERVKRDIQRKITELRHPKNKASTIKWKKSSNPLIGITGRLRQSIDYVVKVEGG